MTIFIKRARAAVMFLPFLFACSTYNNKLNYYYTELHNNNLTQAQAELNNNKILQKKRNKILYYLEQGKLYRLRKELDSSNLFFNAADGLIENNENNLGNFLLSNISSPMAGNYKQEDFEIFLMHYYKALNYLQLGNTEEAVVEARRIGLSNNFQKNKFSNLAKGYTQDAFSFIIQGLVYEANNEINNAFISYRNAVDLYLNNGNNFYGTPLPQQLKIDLLRTAKKMGFEDLFNFYASKLNTNSSLDSTPRRELILFFENGISPIKEEQNFVLTSSNNGSFFVTDAWGIRQNINFNSLASNDKLNAIRTLRVAMPVYRIISQNDISIILQINGNNYQTYLAENLNELSTSLLKERWLKELTNVAIRQISKKLLEKGSEKAAVAIAENNTKETNKDGTKKTEEQKKKDNENSKAIGETVGFLVNMFNAVTEKADTRSWQSLPAYISYARVPLKEGENEIKYTLNGIEKTITITAKDGLQFYSIINWK